MSMFNVVIIACPNCAHRIEIQNKAIYLATVAKFELGDIPPAIAGDLHDEIITCEKCARKYQIKTQCLTQLIEYTGELTDVIWRNEKGFYDWEKKRT